MRRTENAVIQFESKTEIEELLAWYKDYYENEVLKYLKFVRKDI